MRLRVIAFVVVAFAPLVGAAFVRGPVPPPARVATTLQDFFQPGSQASGIVVYDDLRNSSNCAGCHLADGPKELAVHAPWQGSMMALAARDPLFLACLAVANQDAAFAGDICIRCHTPGGWIQGRSEPTDGSALTALDRDGVSCSVCHRMVDPVFKPGVSPAIDATLLANIDPLPISPGGGNYVLDPVDFRRGPYTLNAPAGHLWLSTPFIRTSELCATCHDVSNPVFLREPDGTYSVTNVDEAHPTADKYDMFPLERTYSEWLNSDFADGGVDMGGRFGGNLSVVSTCQDCHMPKVTGKGGNFPTAPVRDDLASHDLSGGNAWVPEMVLNLFPNDGLDPVNIEAGKQRAVSMLQRAATLQVTQRGNHIRARIINETGHKLPSGYPEGRRIWLNVRLFDGVGGLILERGAYDAATANLSTQNTKVYEINLGADAAVAALAGIPEGKGFHFALNNVIVKDNRIPPRGFGNNAFRAIQAQPVATTYRDGQFWDDTSFRLTPAARTATVELFYQTASKDYITFLRDENQTNDSGQVLYDQWQLTGMSPPVLMATATITIDPFADGDFNGDTVVDLTDFAAFVATCETGPADIFINAACAAMDFDDDIDADLRDFAELQLAFTN